MGCNNQLVADFSVSLGHLQISVPHLPLQSKQVAAIIQIECCETVSDLIRSKFHTRIAAVFSEIPADPIGVHLITIAGREEPIVPNLRFDTEKFFQRIIR